jgi:lysophospholipase L1-like esterase
MASTAAPAPAEKRITLVGASIGDAWRFDRLGERVALPGYRFAYVGVYAFDKGPLVEQLASAAERPAVVMIKECAAYFPGDLDAYRRNVTSWVERLRRAGIQPLLVTTVPIARSPGYLGRAKHVVKRALGRPTRIDGILQYNDWLKEYAARERLPLFDLEAVVREGPHDRWLRPDFDAGDQLHLNAAAYRAIDDAFAALLRAGAEVAAR